MSFMVAEPDPIPSEKRPLLLYKEQIIEKIDENPEIQTTLATYESMSTSKQNLDIPVSEMMKQLIEVTEIISQDRIQQCTLEQISDTSVSQDVRELDEPCKVLSRTTIRRHCGDESRCDRRDEKHWEGKGWKSDHDRRDEY